MELYVISDPFAFKGETELINSLFESGMSVFHLRKEGMGRADYAALLEGIQLQYHDRIALHQFHELVLDFPGLKRLHYPEWFRRETVLQYLLNNKNGRVLSTSIHQLASLEETTHFDYTFYGPVFNSISKSAYAGIIEPGFTLPVVRPVRIIALGGIEWSNLEQVKAMGFEGLAVLGAIWKDRMHAVSNFKNIQEICRQLDLM
jgi:thiamine-phosphate pyrophosphorylase